MSRHLSPHDTPCPDPTINLQQFKQQYTMEMRESINMAIQRAIRFERDHWIARGMNDQDAGRLARALFTPARRAQQLVGDLHPPVFEW